MNINTRKPSFEKSMYKLIERLSPTKVDYGSIPFEELKEKTKESLGIVQIRSCPALMQSVLSTKPITVPKSFQVVEDRLSPVSSADVLHKNGLCESKHHGMDDEDCRLSSLDSDQDFDLDNSRSSIGSSRRCKSTSASSQSTSQAMLTKSSMKQAIRVRRIQELRTARRQAWQDAERQDFTCAEPDLPQVFGEWYTSALSSTKDSATLFHDIVASLENYFQTVTWHNRKQNLVGEFVKRCVIRSCDELNDHYDGHGEKQQAGQYEIESRLLETELQVLLELLTLEIDDDTQPQNLESTDIIRKLRFIYIAGDANRMKKFLEEHITDIFFDRMPKVLTELYEEMCIPLPDDLAEHASPDKDDPTIPAFPTMFEREDLCSQQPQSSNGGTTAQERMAQLLAETYLEPTDKENGSSSQSVGVSPNLTALNSRPTRVNGERKQRNSRDGLGHQAALPLNGELVKSIAASPHRRRTSRIIPETPEDKLRSVKVELPEDSIAEVVKQTPMGKLKVNGNDLRASRRLSALVQLSEERARPTRAAALAAEKANRNIIKATIGPASSKQLLVGLNTPSPRPQRAARLNLVSRFTDMQKGDKKDVELNGTPPHTNGLKRKATEVSLKPSGSPEQSKRSKKNGEALNGVHPSSSSSSTTTSPKQPKDDAIPGFGLEQLKRYKQRIHDIVKSKNIDANNSSTSGKERQNLYEDVESVKVDASKVQKNRTGRTVRHTAGSMVYIAHTLLNVHNPSPLELHKRKVPASPQKLHKLVRIAKKKNAMKLRKLRNQQMKLHESPSASQRSENSSASQ